MNTYNIITQGNCFRCPKKSIYFFIYLDPVGEAAVPGHDGVSVAVAILDFEGQAVAEPRLRLKQLGVFLAEDAGNTARLLHAQHSCTPENVRHIVCKQVEIYSRYLDY